MAIFHCCSWFFGRQHQVNDIFTFPHKQHCHQKARNLFILYRFVATIFRNAQFLRRQQKSLVLLAPLRRSVVLRRWKHLFRSGRYGFVHTNAGKIQFRACVSTCVMHESKKKFHLHLARHNADTISEQILWAWRIFCQIMNSTNSLKWWNICEMISTRCRSKPIMTTAESGLWKSIFPAPHTSDFEANKKQHSLYGERIETFPQLHLR